MISKNSTTRQYHGKRLFGILCWSILILGLVSCSKGDIGTDQGKTFIKFFGSLSQNSGVDVKQTSDGGYIVLGTCEINSKASNMTLIKTDRYGNEQWTRQYGDTLDNSASRLQITSDGYVLLGTISDGVQTDLYLVRVLNNGDTLWTKKFGTTTNDQAGSVIVNGNGDYLIVGYTTTTVTGKDAYWALVDQNGSLQWDQTFGSTDDDYLVSAVQTSDGYVLLGTTKDRLLIQGVSDAFVLKIKNDGNLVNSANIGDKGETQGKGVLLLSDGSLLCAGTNIPSGSTNSGIILCRLTIDNSNNNILWKKTITLSSSATCESITTDSNNNYLLTGTLTGSDSNEDISLVKADAEGNLIWSKAIGETANQTGNAVFTTSDAGAVTVGTNEINGNSVIALVKVKNDGSL